MELAVNVSNVIEKQLKVGDASERKNKRRELPFLFYDEVPKKYMKYGKKVSKDDFSILDFDEYEMLLENNYNLKQLKSMCKHYKLKVGGNKKDLMNRLYNFLKFSNYAIKIQKIAKGMLTRNLCKLKNISKFKSAINDTDFFTLESINKLKFEDIYCYSDNKNNVYVFSIRSLYHYYKNNDDFKNPYNRKHFNVNVKRITRRIRKLSKILGYNVYLELDDLDDDISDKTKLDLKITEIFQKMDAFGFITNRNWFLDLNASKLKKFFCELVDVWQYRAQLTNYQKSRILPNNIHIFSTISNNLFHKDINIIRYKLIDIIDKLISSGVDKESRSLGVNYVLGSLTTVNYDAATTLPWLFEAFAHL